MPPGQSSKLKPMGIRESLITFGIPTVLLYAATHYGVPYLTRALGIPPVVSWFVCGGILVFIPIFVFSLVFYQLEAARFAFKERFRLRKPSQRDLLWGFGSIIVISVSTALIMVFLENTIASFTAQPSFMKMQPLSGAEYWILLAWLPFFFFNIAGEELFWRGYVFPRQELVFGEWTWVVNGCLWMMFHLSFGLNLMITLLPIIFGTTFAIQKTKNTSVGILIHGFVNGTGFLLISFGLA